MASLVSFMDWKEENLIDYLESKDINHESLENLKGNVVIYNSIIISYK